MIGVLPLGAPLAGAVLGGLYLAFDLAVLPALGSRDRVAVGGPEVAADRPPVGAREAARRAGAGGAGRATGSGDEVAAEVMRSINVAIVRPAFLALLFGGPALAVAAAVVSPGPWTIGAALLAAAGLAVTLVVNVPRNEALAREDDPGAWSRFLGPWRRAHRVRTAAALLGAAAGAAALL